MKTIVMIPTYNERENIASLCLDILKINHDIEILVVDDNSPDKTFEVVQELEKRYPKIHLLLRTKNRGRGSAGIDGFRKCLEFNPDFVIEMDADYSHDPKFILDLITAGTNTDVVLGSRYIDGGKDIDRGIIRRIVSFCAKMYIRIILGIKQNDPTSGYRLFRRDILDIILPKLHAKDPFIVTEVLYYANKYNFRIKEVPIVFEDRREGESKLGMTILFSYLWKVLKLRTRK